MWEERSICPEDRRTGEKGRWMAEKESSAWEKGRSVPSKERGMRPEDDSFSSTERSLEASRLWTGRGRRGDTGMAHGAANAARPLGGRVVLAKSAFDQADAGLREFVVILPQSGGEGDGSDFSGLCFDLGGFRIVGGCSPVFQVGDPLGGIGILANHLGFIFFEDAYDLSGVVFFLCVGEV